RPDARTDAALSVRYGDALDHFPTKGSGATVSHNQHQLDRGPSLGLDVGHVFSDQVESHLTGTWHRDNAQYAIAPNDSSDTKTFPFSSSDWVTRAGLDGRTNVRLSGGDVVTIGAGSGTRRCRGARRTEPERAMTARGNCRLDADS